MACDDVIIKKTNSDAYFEAHQTKKGNTWHFGYKDHIVVAKGSCIIHAMKAPPANVHDMGIISELHTGEAEAVNGDSNRLGAGSRK